MQAGITQRRRNVQEAPQAGRPDAGRPDAGRPDAGRPDEVPTFFHQECPACGRKLQVFVQHLGQQIACQSCGCHFIAADPDTPHRNTTSALERADQLLARCSSDDQALNQRVFRFLHTRGVKGLDNVHVDVNQGVVALRGRVASARDRWLCSNCAQRVAGVIRVVDELEIEKGAGRKRSGA